jgi:hypothetical protein
MPRSEAIMKFTSVCEDLIGLIGLIGQYGALTMEEKRIVENYCRDLLILSPKVQGYPDPPLPKDS